MELRQRDYDICELAHAVRHVALGGGMFEQPVGDRVVRGGLEEQIDEESAGIAGFGVAVRTSEDEGETWSDETPLIDPKGRAPESELDAGYPVIVPLNDGRLLVVFYAYDPDMTWRHPHPEWPAVADAKVQRFLAANVLAER